MRAPVRRLRMGACFLPRRISRRGFEGGGERFSWRGWDGTGWDGILWLFLLIGVGVEEWGVDGIKFGNLKGEGKRCEWGKFVYSTFFGVEFGVGLVCDVCDVCFSSDHWLILMVWNIKIVRKKLLWVKKILYGYGYRFVSLNVWIENYSYSYSFIGIVIVIGGVDQKKGNGNMGIWKTMYLFGVQPLIRWFGGR